MGSLPTIMRPKNKQSASGQLLLEIMGVKQKRMPREVNEAATKLINALDRIKEL